MTCKIDHDAPDAIPRDRPSSHVRLDRGVRGNIMKKPTIQGRAPNKSYRVREHLTEDEMAKLLKALKGNRHGHRDWLIGLIIYRHGLRVSECCDLRWDDLDFPKRTIAIRRLKGSIDSVHFLERDELTGLKRLQKEQEPKAAYVFVNERGSPFGRMGIARMIERAGEEAKIGFPVHVHMLRHSCGYALAGKGMDTRRLQHYLGHASITNTVGYTAMSPEPFKNLWK
jgi:site-specific recombinase XerD